MTSVFHVFYLRFQVGPVAEQANFLSPYSLSLLLPLHNCTPIVQKEYILFKAEVLPFLMSVPFITYFHHVLIRMSFQDRRCYFR